MIHFQCEVCQTLSHRQAGGPRLVLPGRGWCLLSVHPRLGEGPPGRLSGGPACGERRAGSAAIRRRKVVVPRHRCEPAAAFLPGQWWIRRLNPSGFHSEVSLLFCGARVLPLTDVAFDGSNLTPSLWSPPCVGRGWGTLEGRQEDPHKDSLDHLADPVKHLGQW